MAEPAAALHPFEVEQKQFNGSVIAAGNGHDIRVFQIIVVNLSVVKRAK